MPGTNVISIGACLASALAACAPPPTAPSAPAVPRTAGVPAAGVPAPAAPPLPNPSYLTGARIVATATGTLIIDADSGVLVKTDGDGVPIARLAIGRDPGLLAFDPDRSIAFVADRERDRVVLVDVGAMKIGPAFPVPAEPFGVALTPDRSTLLVSTIADHTLVALDARTGEKRWSAPLSADPRAVAVSPDGTRALVASIGGGGIDDVALDTHRVTTIPFDLNCDRCDNGPAFARSSGAVVFIDQHRAIAPFQRAVPDSIDNLTDSYYGGGRSPVTQHLAFLSFGKEASQVVAQVIANNPRSLLWDEERDTLLVAGLASDTLLHLPGLTRGTTDDVDQTAQGFVLRPRETCGPDGLAFGADDTIYVWCSLSRTIIRFSPPDPQALGARRALDEGKPIVASALTAVQHRGMVLFNSVHREISRDLTLACTSCHIDGRTDGHSWKIREHSLQTPMLAGRIAQTAPYKWDGHDATIQDSITSTVGRLNGTGLTPTRATELIAYLQSLRAPRKPTGDVAAIARGKRVFEQRGCDDCHQGSRFTDGAQHIIGGHIKDPINVVDTPSLIGLAASAPYFHDGSAPTLDVLVRGGGNIRGMSDMSKLDEVQRADLVAFLASL